MAAPGHVPLMGVFIPKDIPAGRGEPASVGIQGTMPTFLHSINFLDLPLYLCLMLFFPATAETLQYMRISSFSKFYPLPIGTRLVCCTGTVCETWHLLAASLSLQGPQDAIAWKIGEVQPWFHGRSFLCPLLSVWGVQGPVSAEGEPTQMDPSCLWSSWLLCRGFDVSLLLMAAHVRGWLRR